MVVDVSSRMSAWAQISYTSADSGTTEPGGWGVKEAVGCEDEFVLNLLRQGVTTKFEALDELTDFPSTTQLMERPRRLLYRLVAGHVTLWHSAAAGADATGRPGNVFNHAAYQIAPAPRLRPIEMWRSDSWAVPFGPREVAATRLPNTLQGGAKVTVDSVVDFIQGETQRRFSLEWLLAAAAHALATGTTLVLGVDSPDEAALWIGAISFLTSPVQARQFSWVTFERLGAIQVGREERPTVVCVPRGDLVEGNVHAGGDLIVLDPLLSLEEEGANWRHEGTSFPRAPEWQNAMLDLFAMDRGSALAVLARADDLCWQITEEEARRLPFSWPLWMAMLSLDGQIAHRATRVVDCLTHAPPSTLQSVELLALVKEVALDGEARKLLMDRAGSSDYRADLRDVIAAVETARAADFVALQWRNGSVAPGIDPGAAAQFGPDTVPEVSASLRAAIEQSSSAQPEKVLASSRLVAFVVGLGIDPPPEDDAVPSLGSDAIDAVRARLEDAELAMPDVVRAAALADLDRARRGRPSLAPPAGGLVLPVPAASDVRRQLSASSPNVDLLTEQAFTHELTSLPDERSAPSIPVVVDALPADGLAAQLHQPLETLLAMLSGARRDSERASAIADCVLVLYGVAPVPLRGPIDDGDQACTRAEEVMLDQKLPPVLVEHATRWLAVYWALVEMGQSGDGAPPRPAPLAFVERAVQDRDARLILDELSRFRHETSDELRAAFKTATNKPQSPFSTSSLLYSPCGPYFLGHTANYRKPELEDYQKAED